MKGMFSVLCCCEANFVFFCRSQKKILQTVCQNEISSLVTWSWLGNKSSQKHNISNDSKAMNIVKDKKLSLTLYIIFETVKHLIFHWNGYNSFKRVERHFRDVIKLLAHQHQLWRARELELFFSSTYLLNKRNYIRNVKRYKSSFFFCCHLNRFL